MDKVSFFTSRRERVGRARMSSCYPECVWTRRACVGTATATEMSAQRTATLPSEKDDVREEEEGGSSINAHEGLVNASLRTKFMSELMVTTLDVPSVARPRAHDFPASMRKSLGVFQHPFHLFTRSGAMPWRTFA
ncbi:hypothetical protein AAE478_000001 [Parahypoxylon ruwenzoriense]